MLGEPDSIEALERAFAGGSVPPATTPAPLADRALSDALGDPAADVVVARRGVSTHYHPHPPTSRQIVTLAPVDGLPVTVKQFDDETDADFSARLGRLRGLLVSGHTFTEGSRTMLANAWRAPAGGPPATVHGPRKGDKPAAPQETPQGTPQGTPQEAAPWQNSLPFTPTGGTSGGKGYNSGPKEGGRLFVLEYGALPADAPPDAQRPIVATQGPYVLKWMDREFMEVAAAYYDVTLDDEGVPVLYLDADAVDFEYAPPTFNACTYTAAKDYLAARWGRTLDQTDRDWLAEHPWATDSGIPEEATFACLQQLVEPYGMAVDRVRVKAGSLMAGERIETWVRALGCNPFGMVDHCTTNEQALTKLGITDPAERAAMAALWRFEFHTAPLPGSIVGEQGWSSNASQGVQVGSGGGHARYLPPRGSYGNWRVSVQLAPAEWLQAHAPYAEPPALPATEPPRRGRATLLLTSVRRPDGLVMAATRNNYYVDADPERRPKTGGGSLASPWRAPGADPFRRTPAPGTGASAGRPAAGAPEGGGTPEAAVTTPAVTTTAPGTPPGGSGPSASPTGSPTSTGGTDGGGAHAFHQPVAQWRDVMAEWHAGTLRTVLGARVPADLGGKLADKLLPWWLHVTRSYRDFPLPHPKYGGEPPIDDADCYQRCATCRHVVHDRDHEYEEGLDVCRWCYADAWRGVECGACGQDFDAVDEQTGRAQVPTFVDFEYREKNGPWFDVERMTFCCPACNRPITVKATEPRKFMRKVVALVEVVIPHMVADGVAGWEDVDPADVAAAGEAGDAEAAELAELAALFTEVEDEDDILAGEDIAEEDDALDLSIEGMIDSGDAPDPASYESYAEFVKDCRGYGFPEHEVRAVWELVHGGGMH